MHFCGKLEEMSEQAHLLLLPLVKASLKPRGRFTPV